MYQSIHQCVWCRAEDIHGRVLIHRAQCSGERPICALCQARSQVCTYDAEAGLTRIEALRRRNKELTEQNADYEIIFDVLRTEPENKAIGHLLHLRAAIDVESYANTLRQDIVTTKRQKSTIIQQAASSSSARNQGSPSENDPVVNAPPVEPVNGHSRMQDPYSSHRDGQQIQVATPMLMVDNDRRGQQSYPLTTSPQL